MKNPFVVTYNDLIESTEKRILWMEANYPGQIIIGRITDRRARHNIEIEKTKLTLFKKFKKDPQIDLFTEFEKMKR